jgi:peptidoglycan-associated lipoprotein
VGKSNAERIVVEYCRYRMAFDEKMRYEWYLRRQVQVKKTLAVAVLGLATMAFVGAGCAKKKVAAVAPQDTTPAPAAAPAERPTAAVNNTPNRTTTQTGPQTTPRDTGRPDAVTQARIETLLSRIEDAYFDYDKHTLRPDAISALKADSTELRDIISQYPTYKLTIEGHCDERGSEAYNMALGDARAKAAKDYLVGVGISPSQLGIISYGKDKPQCDDKDEACYQKNRRIHIVASK